MMKLFVMALVACAAISFVSCKAGPKPKVTDQVEVKMGPKPKLKIIDQLAKMGPKLKVLDVTKAGPKPKIEKAGPKPKIEVPWRNLG